MPGAMDLGVADHGERSSLVNRLRRSAINRFVVVASKGGAPNHPAWFLNLRDRPDIRFQVEDKKYRGFARITSGAERERLFRMMTKLYPPYNDYQAKTAREIPVVTLEPLGRSRAPLPIALTLWRAVNIED